MLDGVSWFWLGGLASLAAGAATGVGALPALIARGQSRRLMNLSLGLAAGVMLAATSFSLVLPAIEAGGGGIPGASIALAGVLLGGLVLDGMDRYLPPVNLARGPEASEGAGGRDRHRMMVLFILSITLHNLPEGLAVGVAFGGGETASGLTLALAIGLQNMPEGLAVALPMIQHGYRSGVAVLVALATGLVEPLGALSGMMVLQIGQWVLPWGLAFAAGAMLFVIAYEVIPETQRLERSSVPVHGVVVGFVVMMFLDTFMG